MRGEVYDVPYRLSPPRRPATSEKEKKTIHSEIVSRGENVGKLDGDVDAARLKFGEKRKEANNAKSKVDELSRVLKKKKEDLAELSKGIAKLSQIDGGDLEKNRNIRNEKMENLRVKKDAFVKQLTTCLLYTSPSPRDQRGSRMPSSA